MAGRGCTIVVKVLGGSTGAGEIEELSLPVALHSPLQVLKEQLTEIVGIPVGDQVLILCDLSDPDRNSDVLLVGRDFMTLRSCGIKSGTTLTLHALGVTAEEKQRMTMDALAKKVEVVDPNEKPRLTLATETTAAAADHSYNGVIFDIACNGPFVVDLKSISLAGMLGRVRIFARDRPWEDDQPKSVPSPHWWAHRESVSAEGWVLIADRLCRPSWDKPVEIKFDQAVRLLPHQSRGLYCHSHLPDDLGIQYQSYSKDDIVASDEHITILPGLGHTGSRPFDEMHGWYRAYRSLAGSVSYCAEYKGWSPFDHKIFPKQLRKAVVTMLLCQNKLLKGQGEGKGKGGKVEEVEGKGPANPSPGSSSSSGSSHYALASGASGAMGGAYGAMEVYGAVMDDSGASMEEVVAMEDSRDSRESGMMVFGEMVEEGEIMGRGATPAEVRAAQAVRAVVGHDLSALPVHVVYNILEFMHWDWFEELDIAEAVEDSTLMMRSRLRASMTTRGRGGEQGLLFRLLQQVGALQGEEYEYTHSDDEVSSGDVDHDEGDVDLDLEEDSEEEEEEEDSSEEEDDGEGEYGPAVAVDDDTQLRASEAAVHSLASTLGMAANVTDDDDSSDEEEDGSEVEGASDDSDEEMEGMD